MNKELFRITDLHKSYRNGHKEVGAVNGVSFSINKKTFTAIVGPSGAGKSTLLHMMGALDRPTSGHILFEDVDLYRLSDSQRATFRNSKIGFVFQFYHLLPEFTVLENVMLPVFMSANSGREGRISIRNKAIKILQSVGLGHRMDHIPSRLSGGEAQRVAIARALINDPQALLCDEPTGNLDSKNSEAIYKLLFSIKEERGTALVIVSHDDKVASRADYTISLKDGKLI